SNWRSTLSSQVLANVKQVTFRSLLLHSAGFCSPNAPYKQHGFIERYSGIQAMIQLGPDPAMFGVSNYCNLNYALLRILIPYVVDGPQAYAPFENLTKSNPHFPGETDSYNEWVTDMSYRNYVRGRIFDPIVASPDGVTLSGV